MTDHEETLRTIALTYGHDAKLHELNEQTQTAAIERNRQAACLAGAEAIAREPQLVEKIERLEDVLSGIAIYCSDTLSGKADGQSDMDWYCEGVTEIAAKVKATIKEMEGLR